MECGCDDWLEQNYTRAHTPSSLSHTTPRTGYVSPASLSQCTVESIRSHLLVLAPKSVRHDTQEAGPSPEKGRETTVERVRVDPGSPPFCVQNCHLLSHVSRLSRSLDPVEGSLFQRSKTSVLLEEPGVGLSLATLNAACRPSISHDLVSGMFADWNCFSVRATATYELELAHESKWSEQK